LANVVTFVVYAALGGALFLLPIQLEQVSGYTALRAGISLLPVTAIMLLLSARSAALAARIGPRLQMTARLAYLRWPLRAWRRPRCRHNPEPAPRSRGTGPSGSCRCGSARVTRAAALRP
jgi:hypothetical protein